MIFCLIFEKLYQNLYFYLKLQRIFNNQNLHENSLPIGLNGSKDIKVPKVLKPSLDVIRNGRSKSPALYSKSPDLTAKSSLINKTEHILGRDNNRYKNNCFEAMLDFEDTLNLTDNSKIKETSNYLASKETSNLNNSSKFSCNKEDIQSQPHDVKIFQSPYYNDKNHSNQQPHSRNTSYGPQITRNMSKDNSHYSPSKIFNQRNMNGRNNLPQNLASLNTDGLDRTSTLTNTNFSETNTFKHNIDSNQMRLVGNSILRNTIEYLEKSPKHLRPDSSRLSNKTYSKKNLVNKSPQEIMNIQNDIISKKSFGNSSRDSSFSRIIKVQDYIEKSMSNKERRTMPANLNYSLKNIENSRKSSKNSPLKYNREISRKSSKNSPLKSKREISRKSSKDSLLKYNFDKESDKKASSVTIVGQLQTYTEYFNTRLIELERTLQSVNYQQDHSQLFLMDTIIMPLMKSVAHSYDLSKINFVISEVRKGITSYKHTWNYFPGKTLKPMLETCTQILCNKASLLRVCDPKMINQVQKSKEPSKNNSKRDITNHHKKKNEAMHLQTETSCEEYSSFKIKDSPRFTREHHNYNKKGIEDYKGRFYEQLMEIKFNLPQTHPAKHILVSDCYLECQKLQFRTFEEAINYTQRKHNIKM